ncbi:hypothetical protein R75777_06332 [Paraburkholderia nemoris]|nr:hypothetical protein R75777_06332 [Paraburkholderia nemoris]
MTFRAYTLIDGYPIAWASDNYDRWLFEYDDRIIRTRPKGQRHEAIHALPEDPSEWIELETDYLYVTTAQTLRKRLDRTWGYNRRELQAEFNRYRKLILKQDLPRFLYGEGLEHTKALPERAEILRATTLDDWLAGLKEVIRRRLTAVNEPIKLTPDSPNSDLNKLVEIIIADYAPKDYDLLPGHPLWGFPCRRFEHLAVAVLEVVPDNAECVLDVTELVKNEYAYCFEDLILANEGSAPV